MTRSPPIVLALIGRPNVGKSTLFNRITNSRSALVADMPGLTRDRKYGRTQLYQYPLIVIDTGGFNPLAKDGIDFFISAQAKQAVIESDVVAFVVDGKCGLLSDDYEIADFLRRFTQKVFLVVNKTESMSYATKESLYEMCKLGYGNPVPISAVHGRGMSVFYSSIKKIALQAFVDTSTSRNNASFPQETNLSSRSPENSLLLKQDHPLSENTLTSSTSSIEIDPERQRRIQVAIVGRPNVGKSTLINTLIGEERLVTFDQAGTTRDCIEIDFDLNGAPMTLVDTAGLRKKARVQNCVEKFSVIKTLQSIERCNVCVLLLSVLEPISEQDMTIARYILESGKALVIGINKKDLAKAHITAQFNSSLEHKLGFLNFATRHFISAKEGKGLKPLMTAVQNSFRAAMTDLPTHKLNTVLSEMLIHQKPPSRNKLHPPKLRYIHQGGRNPPILVVHGTAIKDIPASYCRYIESWFRKKFNLSGTPIKVQLVEKEKKDSNKA